MQSSTHGNNILSIQRFFNAIIVENFTIIESLKSSGFSMTVRAPAGGKEALHVACEAAVSAECVSRLITLGANVNAMTDRGFTPLHVASQQGRNDLMIALIKSGANLEAVSDDGLGTPLQEAAANGQLQALKILVAAGADTHYRERKYNLTAMDLAKINARRMVAPLNDIAAAILGAEKTFTDQTSITISAWQRDHVSQNQNETDYVARLLAIPFADLTGDQCFLRLQSALQENYEVVKKNLAPLRIAMVKFMKQYNEAKSTERKLRAIFAEPPMPNALTTGQTQEVTNLTVVPIGSSIFSAIPPASATVSSADANSTMTSINPGSSTSAK